VIRILEGAGITETNIVTSALNLPTESAAAGAPA
jgi:hypothetical protein